MQPEQKRPPDQFIRMLESFVAGENTSRDFVSKMESEFYACALQEDDRFSDLQMALDMFGVPAKDYGYDDKMLSHECRYALRLLKGGA